MWKQEYEEIIRRNAIKRSVNTLLGRIGETFAPLSLAKRLQVTLGTLGMLVVWWTTSSSGPF
jgi:Endonuclease related to archaeal Holliday junction resolvase.